MQEGEKRGQAKVIEETKEAKTAGEGLIGVMEGGMEWVEEGRGHRTIMS